MSEDIALSIVIPVYRDEETLEPLCDRFAACIPAGASYEIVFVNDGNLANDVFRTLERLRARSEVRVIHLSRNFGQHVAIAAGLKNARGGHVLVVDSDLQYAPDETIKLFQIAIAEKKDAVISTLRNRTDHGVLFFGGALFYWFMKRMGALPRSDLGSAFLVSRHVARGLCTMSERHRATIPMIYWLYGDIAYVEVTHHERRHGRSSYTFGKLIDIAWTTLISYSIRPLFLPFAFAACTFVATIACALTAHFTAALLAFFSTLVLVSLGILGMYLGQAYENAKGRPLYFVQHSPGESRERVLLFEDPPPNQ